MGNKDVLNWKVINQDENFIVEYEHSKMLYRVSYFDEDDHLCGRIVFKGLECPYGCPGMINEYEAVELGVLKR